MQKIDLLVTDNPYNSVAIFVRGLKDAFERVGLQTRILRMGEGEYDHALTDLLKAPPDLLFSFNYIAFQGEKEDSFLGDALKIPQFTYWLDAAIYAMPLFRSPYNRVSLCDMSDYVGFKGIGKNVCFLPHAVEKESLQENGNRPLDIIMTASYLDFEERRQSWKRRYPKELQKVMDIACESILQGLYPSCMMAIHEALVSCNYFISNNLEEIYYEIEYYCKGKDRFDLLMTLHEFEIHLFGQSSKGGSWSEKLKGISHVRVYDALSYEESLQLLKKAKVVLNSSPQFRQGSHERVFNALKAGCIALTNENPYLQGEFGQDSGILYYHPSKKKELVDKLKEVLEGESKQVQKGRELLFEKHTWDNRAKEIMSFYV